MKRALVGLSTFGNFEFTKLAVESICSTTDQADICIVVGKPGDTATQEFAEESADHVVTHHRNLGFPVAINDIYDTAWKHNDYDYCFIVGNDVIAYPGCLDGMIELADTGDWDMVCGTMLDVQSLIRMHPEAGASFEGPNYLFRFGSRPWELHQPPAATGIEPDCMKDIRNMALFTKTHFIKLGYSDVNFWPNGYYEDNDAARRGVNAGIRAVGAPHCQFFHFWSRTIHQGESRPHHEYFRRNQAYYHKKWGGEFGEETKQAPVHIGRRNQEETAVNYWSNL